MSDANLTSRPRVVVVGGVAVALLSLAVVACGSSSPRASVSPTTAAGASVSSSTTTSGATTGSTAAVAALGCPTTAPAKVPAHQVPGSTTKMVPGAPTTSVGCRYHGSPTGPTTMLAAAAKLPPAPLVAVLNAAAPLPEGAVFHCPVDTGEQDLLLFGYADGAQLMVLVDRSGCLTATNGDLIARPAVFGLLDPVLGHDAT